jgi:hypothetical protein
MIGSHIVFVPRQRWQFGSRTYGGNQWISCTEAMAAKVKELYPEATVRRAHQRREPTIDSAVASETVTTPSTTVEVSPVTIVTPPDSGEAVTDSTTTTTGDASVQVVMTDPVVPETGTATKSTGEPETASLFSDDVTTPATVDVVRAAVPKLADDILSAAVALIETKPEDLTTALQTIKGIGASTAKKIVEALNVK